MTNNDLGKVLTKTLKRMTGELKTYEYGTLIGNSRMTIKGYDKKHAIEGIKQRHPGFETCIDYTSVKRVT